jgi:hypothetical protein
MSGGRATARILAIVAAIALGMSLGLGAVAAQEETATAEDGAPASDAPAEETTAAPDVPLGANLTPPLGALPTGQAIIHAPGSGRAGSSNVSMSPGTQTTGIAREGENAVVAPEAAPAPAPAAEPAPAAATGTTVTEPVAETAVATETDLDADNYADALEWDLGLDPNNADTDADGVADGDELNIYGTDPLSADTDADGATDGEELFGIQTDPLVWDDFSATGEAVAQQVS